MVIFSCVFHCAGLALTTFSVCRQFKHHWAKRDPCHTCRFLGAAGYWIRVCRFLRIQKRVWVWNAKPWSFFCFSIFTIEDSSVWSPFLDFEPRCCFSRCRCPIGTLRLATVFYKTSLTTCVCGVSESVHNIMNLRCTMWHPYRLGDETTAVAAHSNLWPNFLAPSRCVRRYSFKCAAYGLESICMFLSIEPERPFLSIFRIAPLFPNSSRTHKWYRIQPITFSKHSRAHINLWALGFGQNTRCTHRVPQGRCCCVGTYHYVDAELFLVSPDLRRISVR